MAAPFVYGSGAGVASASAISMAWVAGHQKYDIGFAFVQTSNQALTIAGYTQIGSLVGTGAAGAPGSVGASLFWKRADSSSEAAATTTDSGDHQHGKLTAIRGALKSGDPIDVIASGTSGTLDTALSAVGPTTLGDDRLILIFAVTGVDKATSNWSGESCPNLVSITEHYDSSATTGNGGGIAMWYGVLSNAGAVGTFSATGVDATLDAWIIVAVKPHIPPVTSAQTRQTPWMEANPGAGGAMTPMRAGPTGKILCGSDLGGVYLSTDNAVSWQCCGIQRGMNVPHVRSLGFDIQNADIMYSGTEHGIYRTTDGGVSWSLVSADFYCCAVEAFDGDNNVMYAAGHTLFSSFVCSIYKSTNRGASWVAVSHDLPATTPGLRINKLIVHPTDQNTLYIVSANDLFQTQAEGTFFGIWKSTNGGVNWTKKTAALEALGTPQFAWDVAMARTTPSTLYCTTINGTLYSAYTGKTFKTVDGGDNWAEVSSHTGSIVVKNGTSNVVWVIDTARDPGHAEEGFWESTDSGGTWNRIAVLADYDTGWQPSTQWAYGKNLYSTAVGLGQDMSNPLVLFMTNAQFAYRSDDGGLVFDNVFTNQTSLGYWLTRRIECTVGHECQISEANSNIMFIAFYDIGVWRSLDGGQSWQSCNTSAFTGAWNGYGGAGMTICLDPARSNVVWCAMGETTVLATMVKNLQTGDSDYWALSNTGLPASDWFSGMVLDKASSSTNRTLFVTGGNATGDIYKSTDDGASWTSIDTGNKMRAMAIDETDHLLVYAGGEGGLRRSTNGGTSWSAIGLPEFTGAAVGVVSNRQWTGVHCVAVCPSTPDRVYVSVYGSGLGTYRSDDRGATWTKLRTGTYDRFVAVNPSNPNMIYVSSSKAYKAGGVPLTSEGILRSVDGGTTWEYIGENLPWKFAGTIAIDRSNPKKVLVGSPGNGFWMRNFGWVERVVSAQSYTERTESSPTWTPRSS